MPTYTPKAMYLACCLFLVQNIFAQTPSLHFGKKYEEALLFLKKHKNTWELYFENKQVSLSMAIVFPELLRYDADKDFIETQLLKSLYVKQGTRYSDFSIGYFQMKPSFAEAIEQIMGTKTAETQKTRKERIIKLQSLEGQLQYLSDFYKIVYRRYPKLYQYSDIEQVRFLASAYNYGFLAKKTIIQQWATEKAFPNGKKALVRFSYADIAQEFYERYTPRI